MSRETKRTAQGSKTYQGARVSVTTVTTQEGTLMTPGEGELQWREVTLTDDQIKALEASPFELVPAPGAGKFNELVSAHLIKNFVQAYDASNSQLRVKYASGAVLSDSMHDVGFFSSTGEAFIAAYRPTGIAAVTQVTRVQAENQALVLADNFGAGELTGGDPANTLRVIVSYREWSF